MDVIESKKKRRSRTQLTYEQQKAIFDFLSANLIQVEGEPGVWEYRAPLTEFDAERILKEKHPRITYHHIQSMRHREFGNKKRQAKSSAPGTVKGFGGPKRLQQASEELAKFVAEAPKTITTLPADQALTLLATVEKGVNTLLERITNSSKTEGK